MLCSEGKICQPICCAWFSCFVACKFMACKLASSCVVKKRFICSWFSSGNIEHVAYNKVPPTLRLCQVVSRIRCCKITSASISAGFLCHFISGCRLITPVAEQGASSKILSNFGSVLRYWGSLASASNMLSLSLNSSSCPKRARFSRVRVLREPIASIAYKLTELRLARRY